MILFSLKRRAAALVLVVIMTGVISVMQTDRAHAKPIRWLFAGAGAAAIAADAEASHFLDNTRPFVMKGKAVSVIPSDWNALPIVSFTNFNAISNALGSGRIEVDTKGVMYDYEKWEFTPQQEQQNPGGYLKQAADLAHARGLLFLTAPATNLVTVIAPEKKGNRRFDAYLQLGIAADAARYADVYDIQAQGAEANTERYANFVRQAAAQARAANAKVVVLAGISTNPSGQHVTADDIVRAIEATRDVVDGYWFNIPKPSQYCPRCNDFRPDIAVEVLRRLQ